MTRNIFLIIMISLLMACKKDEPVKTPDPEPETSPITITFLHPTADASVNAGDSVLLSVFLSDELSLHEYVATVSGNDNKEYFRKEGHTHLPETQFDWKWKNTAQAGEKLTFSVTASNHNNDILKKSINFTCSN